MKLLAFETATEACSVALYLDGEVRERFELAPRRHAELALPWAGALLAEAGGHWHDYGKAPRAGRKVGHATLRNSNPAALSAALERIGQILHRQSQVAPPIDALRAL